MMRGERFFDSPPTEACDSNRDDVGASPKQSQDVQVTDDRLRAEYPLLIFPRMSPFAAIMRL